MANRSVSIAALVLLAPYLAACGPEAATDIAKDAVAPTESVPVEPEPAPAADAGATSSETPPPCDPEANPETECPASDEAEKPDEPLKSLVE